MQQVTHRNTENFFIVDFLKNKKFLDRLNLANIEYHTHGDE